MLVYRPLIAAYRTAAYAPVRRYLLREFASPLLHADVEETLSEITRTRDVSLVDVPERLAAEIALREQLLRLRLVSGDVQRRTGGGLWTKVARKAQVEWQRSPLPVAALARACGKLLGPMALHLLKTASAGARAMSLASLGEMGAGVGMAALADELAHGPMPAAAAVGFSRLGTTEAALALVRAVDSRGLDRIGAVVGIALGELACAPLIPLVDKLLAHPSTEVQEQAAWALDRYPADVADALASRVKPEADAFVRLNLIRSLGRLGVPGGMASLSRLVGPQDSDLVQLALIRAAGHCSDPAARTALEAALRAGTHEHQAEALQSLIVSGGAGDPYIGDAETAAAATHERLALNGMLAMVVWAPDQAYRMIKKVFDERPSGRWYCATYALRYLRAPGVVRILRRVCETTAGMDLEEVAVDALARHMGEEGILDHIADVLRKRPSASVVRCIAHEIARYLPAEKAMEAGHIVRHLITSRLDPAVHAPLLETLGALGGEGDLELLMRHANGPIAVSAVRGIELLANEAAVPPLEELMGRAAAEVREAALLALFRLGSPSATRHLDHLVSALGLHATGALLVQEMALSIRCTRDLPRLALLHGELSRIVAGETIDRSADTDPAASDGGAGHRGAQDLVTALESLSVSSQAPIAPTDPASRAPAMDGVPPEGTGDHLYRALAGHLGLGAQGSSRVRWWVAAAVAALIVGVIAWAIIRMK